MKAIFVDTSHFVTVFNPSDQWHASALEVENQLQQVKRVTTELVLVEVLNYYHVGEGSPISESSPDRQAPIFYLGDPTERFAIPDRNSNYRSRLIGFETCQGAVDTETMNFQVDD